MSVEQVHLAGARILVVDDVAANRNLLSHTLESAGYTVSAAPSGEVALEIALVDVPDLVLLDIVLPGLDGFEVCRRLNAGEQTRGTPVIFITAKDEPASVLEGFRAGGVDYVTKPFQTDEVLARVETHLRISRLTQALAEKNTELAAANEKLQSEIDRRRLAENARHAADEQLSVYASREAERWGIAGFLGKSPTLKRILNNVRRLQAVSGATSVLITGESGTGKELIARAIHFGGLKADGPFLPLNCSAIPDELAESTLFGHVRGAFTGAQTDRKGCFELAHGGTLFLDEISEMPVALQPKLLRVLEDGLVLPVGATQERHVDTRILAASNADFGRLLATGRFRQDLYFRLARFTVEVPPLRERREDIPLLVEHFLEMFAREMNLAKPALSAASLAALQQYDFPGNVRELKNIVERSLIESGGAEITPEHLHFLHPARGVTSDDPDPPPRPGWEARRGAPTDPPARSDEDRILAYVTQHGTINNTDCRRLLSVGMHRAWYLLHKMHQDGQLKQESGRRWAQYRLPG
jgi:DNA-binding NtrC family response regulator